MTNSSLPTIDEMLARPFAGLDGHAEQRLQELSDREEIRELIARYAQLVVRGQSMTEMFTEDGVLAIRKPGLPVQEASGHEALEALFGEYMASPELRMPTVHNLAIQVAGDEAIATSWVHLNISDDRDPDGLVFAGCGTYDDKLRRENGRWKFARREAVIRIIGAVQRTAPMTAD